MEIRRTTNCNSNLDEVMRKVYTDTFVKHDRGYTDEDFESACLSVADSPEIHQVFDDRVRGRKQVDFEKYLGYAGLKIAPKKSQPSQGFLGVKAREDSGRVIVSNVLSTSSAEESGISPQDEIVGVDGLRIDKAKLVFYLSNRKPDEIVSLLVARSGAFLQLKSKLSERPIFEHRILKKDSASDTERQLFRSWLNEDWERDIKYEEFTPSPTRKPQLDYF
jgi:predicted metalloprotease with PDZ domain